MCHAHITADMNQSSECRQCTDTCIVMGSRTVLTPSLAGVAFAFPLWLSHGSYIPQHRATLGLIQLIPAHLSLWHAIPHTQLHSCTTELQNLLGRPCMQHIIAVMIDWVLDCACCLSNDHSTRALQANAKLGWRADLAHSFGPSRPSGAKGP